MVDIQQDTVFLPGGDSVAQGRTFERGLDADVIVTS